MKRVVPAEPAGENDFAQLVRALCAPGNGGGAGVKKRQRDQALPSRQSVGEIVEALRSVLFPGYFGFSEIQEESLRFHVGSQLDHIRRTLQEQIKRGLCFACEEWPECLPECDQKARDLTGAFLRQLPEVQRKLALDVQAAYEGDPAAANPDEVIFCYPGIVSHHELPPGPRAAHPRRPDHPADDHRGGPQRDGHRHPPRGGDRGAFLHRPRNRGS